MNTELIKVSNYELHLKSTVGELLLYDAEFDINKNLKEVITILQNNTSQPGVILTKNNKFHGFISRKSILEKISKPFGLELYLNRTLSYFYEVIDNKELIILSATTTIINAANIALERKKIFFDDPIIIEFENGHMKILDSYILLLAYSEINTIAMDSLKIASDLKTDLLNMAAHDLKNPLSAIIGFSELLKTMIDETNNDSLELVTMIHQSGIHMLQLIEELLNSTVIESGKIQLKKQRFELGELVNAIVYQNRLQAEKKSQIIEYNHNFNTEYYTYGDTLKIRESIENLISNAIKYSPYSSTIFVELKKINNYNTIQFSVKDSGPGLSPEDKTKIFGKFQRCSAQPTAGESSTGLGLFIAKQIIELHDGCIYVDSKFGVGSTFYVELPIS